MVLVKICGITCLEDALAAVSFGADAIGFVFAESPRRVDPLTVAEIVRRIPGETETVGVFANDTVDRIREILDECGLTAVQLHGDESEMFAEDLGCKVIKALRVGNGTVPDYRAFPNAVLLMDTYVPGCLGGTGQCFDRNLALEAAAARPIILAGGLNPDNVAEAVAEVRPYGVDVSGGVEREPGRKDHGKLERFIRRAKAVGVRAGS